MKRRRKERDISQIEDECLACLAFIAYRTRRTTKRELCKVLAVTTRLTDDTEDEKRSGWWEYKFSNMHFAFKPLEGRVINGILLEPSATKGAESNPGVQANIRDYALEYFLNDFDRCVSMARAALDKPLPSDIEEAVFGTTAGVPSKAYISQSEADAIARRSPEGARRLRQHWYLERDSSLPKEAKRRFIEIHGELYCEACGLRPVPTYGYPLVDAHHRIPLSEYAKRGKLETEATDFIILCPSCHRAVHKHEDCDIDSLKASLPKGGVIFRS
jgi:5-methylcytosine-specific restriction endonuclease McrA